MKQETKQALAYLAWIIFAAASGVWLGFLLDNEETRDVPIDADRHQGEVYVVDEGAWCPETDHECHATGKVTIDGPMLPDPGGVTTSEHDHDM